MLWKYRTVLALSYVFLFGIVHPQEDEKPLVLNTQPACKRACDELERAFPSITFRGEEARVDLWSQFQAQAWPECRVRPQDAAGVASTLAIARRWSCHFAVLGGGTSPFHRASNAEDGITIDLRSMKTMRLQPDQWAVTVGGGTIWADVYEKLDPLNISSAGTRNSMTGVVGSILGGGMSFFSQQHGWTCDNVLELEVVLANSSIVLASENTNSDLFWALRGGGNNFGIVTKLTIETFPQPPSTYTFQRWDMSSLRSVFERLDNVSRDMPPEMQMLATTLAWASQLDDFVVTDRIVTSGEIDLPKTLHSSGVTVPDQLIDIPVLEEHIYERTALQMARVMDFVNPNGYFNYHGSVTVKSDTDTHIQTAEIFFEESQQILSASGLVVFLVYNPVTTVTIEKMRRRGGNALGINPTDGPLTSKFSIDTRTTTRTRQAEITRNLVININLRWSDVSDTPRMQVFMDRMISRMEKTAKASDQYHPYIFLNHCYEKQMPLLSYGDESFARLHRIRRVADPEGIFQRLQPGHHKLGLTIDAATHLPIYRTEF